VRRRCVAVADRGLADDFLFSSTPSLYRGVVVIIGGRGRPLNLGDTGRSLGWGGSPRFGLVPDVHAGRFICF
jgi:hypothetical protein